MKDFLDEYIDTLSSKRQERVYDLLKAAKLDKSDLDALAQKIKATEALAPMVISQEAHNAIIDGSKFNSAYRDIIDRLITLFNSSNDISLLLDTHTSVLSSEIKAIEDEISAMTKSIDNYAFTLSDNGAYDFSFIETFNDDTMRNIADSSFWTDRNGVNFSSNEKAFVNSASGTLTLSPDLEISHSLSGSIVNSNCSGYVTSDTGVSSALNSLVGNGWRVAVSSPRPVSYSLVADTTRQGAQFELELVLNTASPSDSIVLTPFAERPFEILKMDIFVTSESQEEIETINLVSEPKLIDKPTNFNFALSTVQSIKLIVNQPIYTRGQNQPYVPEERHRHLYTSVLSPASSQEEYYPEISGVFRRNKKALVRTVTSTLNKKLKSSDLRIFKAQTPIIDFDPRKGSFSVLDYMRNDHNNYGTDNLWSSSSQTNILFRKMIQEKLFATSPETIGGKAVFSIVPFYKSGNEQMIRVWDQNNKTIIDSQAKSSTQVDPIAYSYMESNTNHLNYEYDLGFRNIKVGRGNRIFRGVYVTKPLPAKSDSGEVKIKVDDQDYIRGDIDQDSNLATSIEYSVSNVSDPRYETDWIAILPMNYSTNITGERVFFEQGGSAKTRFPCAKSESIRIFRNGYLLRNVTVAFTESSNKLFYTGFRLPVNSIFPNDIYTVDYTAYGDVNFVNFEEKGFDSTNLASAHDANGAGQTFFGTYNGKTITLSYEPYVNQAAVDTFGSYSTTLGFTGTYQPITIVLEDGTVAANQTNYKGLIQNDLSSFDTSTTAYIHSGRNIIFNRNITERFTVYYQYLPSNLKARIVLRVNDIHYVSPQVNSIQIKTKTKKPNPKGLL